MRRPTRSASTPSSERAVFINDLHVPFQDKHALSQVMNFIAWFKPQQLFVVGDLLDFYALSRFDKDPERLLSLQDELDEAHDVLSALRQYAGDDCKMHFLEGNHEHRLERYLWQHPEIAKLTSLKLPALLQLNKINVKHYTYRDHAQWHGLRVEHGDRVRQLSGATACAMLKARGVSGLSGHTHRLASHYHTDEAGDDVWFENGCLCGLKPEYVMGTPNWQHGFAVGFGLTQHRRFLVEQIPIVKHRIYYQGKMWG